VTFDPNGGKTIGIYGHIEWKRNAPLIVNVIYNFSLNETSFVLQYHKRPS
jgi:hypothetical protein